MPPRYSLSQTLSPCPTYRVIDHALDDEVALYPATLPDGAPHPRAGQPRRVVTAIPGSYRDPDVGRAYTWGELGGRTYAIIERVPQWALARLARGPQNDPAALEGRPKDLFAAGGLEARPWFASPVSWDDVPGEARPSRIPRLHPHLQPRWQDRYATAMAHGSTARNLLRMLQRRADTA